MHRTHTTIMSIFILILSWALLPAHAEGYMKIEGIEGNATDKTHEKWISVLSFSEEYNRRTTTGARSTGGTTGEPIIIEKRIDNASPALRKKLAQGVYFPEVELDYGAYKLTLTNASLTSISAKIRDGDMIETISLGYTEIEWTYVSEGKSGNKSTKSASWDFNSN